MALDSNTKSSNSDVANLFRAIFLLIGRNILAIFVFIYLIWSTICTIRVTYPYFYVYFLAGTK